MQGILKQPLIICLIVIFILMFFNYQGWLGIFKEASLQAIGWLQQILYNSFIELNNFIYALINLPELVQENQRLKQSNLALLSELVYLSQVAEENVFLRDQNKIEPLLEQEYILAEVIGQGLRGLDQIIFINKGAKHGVSNDMILVAAKNILIGQIVEVYHSYAKIRLITDSNSQVNALIQENKVSGLVLGQGSDLLFDLLPQGENIEEGQTVLTSGAANLFPKGLILGKIKEVISLDAQISQKAILEPAFRINKLERVLVIK